MVLSSSQQEAAAQQPQSKEELQQALKTAIAAEDYATAARLKEQITEIEMQDPLVGLKLALDAAIAEERYAVSSSQAPTWPRNALTGRQAVSSHGCSRCVLGRRARDTDGCSCSPCGAASPAHPLLR